MIEYLNLMGNAIVDRSPDELIGAVAIALIIALAMAGLYSIGRRKITENLMPMIVLMIIANLISMAIGVGYFQLAHRRMGYTPHRPVRRLPDGPDGVSEFIVQWIFREADRNHDERISGEEASLAAANFVRWADAHGTGSVDPTALDWALKALMFHGREPDHPPDRFDQPGRQLQEFSGPASGPDRSPPRMSSPTDDRRPETNSCKGPSEVTIRPVSADSHNSG